MSSQVGAEVGSRIIDRGVRGFRIGGCRIELVYNR